MEIESSKIVVQKIFGKLKLPKEAENDSKKPDPKSKSIIIADFEYSSNDYNKKQTNFLLQVSRK